MRERPRTHVHLRAPSFQRERETETREARVIIHFSIVLFVLQPAPRT